MFFSTISFYVHVQTAILKTGLVVGRCWIDWKKNHCRYVRWVGCTRRGSLLGQGLLQGGPICRLCRSLGGQVPGQGQAVQTGPSAGEFVCRFLGTSVAWWCR